MQEQRVETQHSLQHAGAKDRNSTAYSMQKQKMET